VGGDSSSSNRLREKIQPPSMSQSPIIKYQQRHSQKEEEARLNLGGSSFHIPQPTIVLNDCVSDYLMVKSRASFVEEACQAIPQSVTSKVDII
jgi:hypothetical protein